MARHRNHRLQLVLFSGIVVLAGCNSGPSVSGTFDRNYSVAGPTRLELTNASGDVDITGSSDGKVHVRGEAALRALGFRQFRVRLHERLARVEISPEEMPRALAPEMAAAIADRLKAAGFTYVALDLEGYRQGSLNETLSPIGWRSAKAARGT